MPRFLVALIAGLSLSTGASAHDFWLQPATFLVAVDTALPLTLQVGHGPARQRSPIPAERIIRFEAVGPDTIIDLRPFLHLGQPDDDATLLFPASGRYLLALETNYTLTTLPAIRFNDYLDAEGLIAVREWRGANGLDQQSGRELYARRAKSIVGVGDGAVNPAITSPVGLSLEIVPAGDPGQLSPGGELPIEVIYDGEPLSGALVKLTDLSADEKPVATALTSDDGKASFTIPYSGQWLLNVIWSVPVPGNPAADYLTTFSSLSFAIQ